MPDDIDWSVTTFEGNRRRQHEEFLALPLREKLERIEQMTAIAEFFASRRAIREAGNKGQAAEPAEPVEPDKPDPESPSGSDAQRVHRLEVVTQRAFVPRRGN